MLEQAPSIAPGGAAADSSPMTVSHVLGEIVWLLSQAPAYKHLFVADLEWFCMPAILLEQYRIFRNGQVPVAVALWARVGEETDARLATAGARLRPDEWNSGETPWLIELVAPFGGDGAILQDMHTTVFKGRPFKFHNVVDGRDTVSTYGADVNTPSH